jgi:hypothetical protein
MIDKIRLGNVRLGHSRQGAAALAFVAALAIGFLSGGPALSQSADCTRLQQAIASASRDSGAGQAQAAAERQRGELNRTVAYAHSIGCDNRKFLFFGSDPPAQCGEITGQIGRMQANLADLQARAGGGGTRAELVARFNSECANGSHSGNLLDALFGGDKSQNVDVEPISPDGLPQEKQSEARGGAEAVCVRSCDGSFFPVSYAASSGRMSELEDKCRSLCPNADVSVYTMPTNGDIIQALSSTGQAYTSSPTALKYRQSYDSSCSCRRKGESWAETLAPAEAKYGHEARTDIVVTPEKSAQMSRPLPDPKLKPSKPGAQPTVQTSALPPAASATDPPPGLDINGADTRLSAAAATISHEASGIAGGAAQTGLKVGEDQGQTVESTGADGVKKKVRIIAPEL